MRTPPALVRLALALALSVLAGAALAGLAFPVIGGLGLVSKGAADQFKPEKPPALVLPQRTKIVDIRGRVIATLFTENRQAVTLAGVPKTARDALIAIEDNRFYEHAGIDVKGTLRALARNSSSGSVQQGGSTLTQQYVKNLLIETASTEEGQKAAVQKSYARKLQEARYALYLEQHMTKDEILEGYFNIAYYGSGVYGIGAAANHYFAKTVARLTLSDSAILAGIVQNPSRFDPIKNPVSAKKRRDVVLDRMLELSYITQKQHDAAVKSPLGIHEVKVTSGCEATRYAPFFCDYVRRYLEDGPAGKALGDTRQERQERLLSGGYTIYTTLDPEVQDAAQKAVDQQVPANDPTDGGLDAAAVADVVEPGTGNIKAMAVDRSFGSGKGQTKVNLAVGGSLGFQGGSTFKAFVLAAALAKGIPPTLTLNSPATYCPKAFKYELDGGGCPGNAGDSEAGRFDMVKATWESVNTYFIQLEERTGLDAPPLLAEQLGMRTITPAFGGGNLPHIPSFVLGTPGVSPLAMAGAYAAFAAQGRFCAPRPVLAIKDPRGKEIPLDNPDCRQVLEPDVANKVTSILRGVIQRGGTGASANIGRPAAGKTGTTNSSKAAWFIGYTPQLATAVWVGKPSVPTNMKNVTINGRGYKQVYGGTVPAAIWKQLMLGALSGYAPQDFPDASLAASANDLTTVPEVTGLPIAQATSLLSDLGFGVAVGPAVNAGPIAAGAVALTTPAVGARVPKGATITLIPSNGLAPVIPTVSPTRTPNAPPTGKPKPTKDPQPTTTPSPTPSPTGKKP